MPLAVIWRIGTNKGLFRKYLFDFIQEFHRVHLSKMNSMTVFRDTPDSLDESGFVEPAIHWIIAGLFQSPDITRAIDDTGLVGPVEKQGRETQSRVIILILQVRVCFFLSMPFPDGNGGCFNQPTERVIMVEDNAPESGNVGVDIIEKYFPLAISSNDRDKASPPPAKGSA